MAIISLGPYIVRTLAFTLDELKATEIYAYFKEGWEMGNTDWLQEQETLVKETLLTSFGFYVMFRIAYF